MSAARFFTMSKAGGVRLEIVCPKHGHSAAVEGTPENAIGTAWAILDSSRLAYEKAGQTPPAALFDALAAIEPYGRVATTPPAIGGAS